MPYQGELNEEPYNKQLDERGWKWCPYDSKGEALHWASELRRYLNNYIWAHYMEVKRNGEPELALIKTFQYAIFPGCSHDIRIADTCGELVPTNS